MDANFHDAVVKNKDVGSTYVYEITVMKVLKSFNFVFICIY